MTSQTPADLAFEQQALENYLREPALGETRLPQLQAALGDARNTAEHGDALWLATLGYLIVIEMLGGTVARPSTPFTSRSKSTESFVAGCQEFAARAVTPKDARALYGLRCALAHEYGLLSASASVRHAFELNRAGALVVHPLKDWEQVTDPADPSKKTWPNPTKQNVTKINVIAVWDFVEELVQNVRNEFAAGNVRIAPGNDAMQLINFGQYLIY